MWTLDTVYSGVTLYIGTVTHLRPVYEFTHLPAAHRRDIIGDQSAVLNSKQGRVSALLLRAVQTQIIGVKTAETAECWQIEE